ncbi:MAG TPA: phosphoribosyltransferase family protein [Gaiellaceae bacterium]|nr:phosphoribosyltransferase family protein [Gaiellaceae bacterium]
MTSPAPFAEGPIFRDRADAGRRLAGELAARGVREGIVVGLARGGVEPAAEVAAELGLPLDVLAVRKVGHPAQAEYAIGAVSPGEAFVREVEGVSPEAVGEAVVATRRTAVELDERLHRAHAALDPAGKTVVLVDDGLATGATMIAAARWARQARAAHVVVAVPVGPDETLAVLRDEADEVVCLETPPAFGAVGLWYEEFGQVSEERVLSLLARAREASRAGDARGGRAAGSRA